MRCIDAKLKKETVFEPTITKNTIEVYFAPVCDTTPSSYLSPVVDSDFNFVQDADGYQVYVLITN